jgi:hypothetical protein
MRCVLSAGFPTSQIDLCYPIYGFCKSTPQIYLVPDKFGSELFSYNSSMPKSAWIWLYPPEFDSVNAGVFSYATRGSNHF